MSRDDVPEDGMTNHELTDSQLEALLEGLPGAPSADHPVAAFFDDARSAFSAVDAPAPTSALSEFVGVGQSTSHINMVPPAPVDAPVFEVPVVDVADVPRRRTRMIPALTAFIGTTVGKIALGGSVAFAATAGAHATGVVDVPGLPDTAATIVDSVDDGSSADSSTTTTNAPSTTATTDGSRSGDSSPSTTAVLANPASSSSSTSSSTSVAPMGQGAVIEIPVADAGTVRVRLDATAPALVSSSASSGWQSRIDDSDEVGEIELIFTNGSSRVDLSVEYDDGMVEARVRDRATGSETYFWYSLEDGSLLRTGLDDDDDLDDDDHDDDSDSDDDDDHDNDSDDDDDRDDDRDDDSDSDDDHDDDSDDDDHDDDSDSDDDDEY